MPHKLDDMDETAPENEGVHEWSSPDQFPPHLKKYWYQRNRIWSEYDSGIWMTEDAWFGVTPESIANNIAVHIGEAVSKEKKTIIDAFAGVGGNAIAFARTGRWSKVLAIEKDAATLKCAKHNAKIYGVDKKIVWVLGDCFEVIPKRFSGSNKPIIFASPPWGGTEYASQNPFDLLKMEPYNLETLYRKLSPVSSHLVLYLPRTSDLNQIARFAPEGRKLDVAHYCISGASKALCIYFGEYDFPQDEATEESDTMEGVEVMQVIGKTSAKRQLQMER